MPDECLDAWEGQATSVQIEFTQRLAFGGILGFAQCFGEALLHEIFPVLFRIHRLAEDRLLALFLLAHRLRSRRQVFEGAFARSRRVADQQPGGRIDLQHRPAIGASYFKHRRFCLCHFNPELYAFEAENARNCPIGPGMNRGDP